jgi:phosphoesterase RecJ-like protein
VAIAFCQLFATFKRQVSEDRRHLLPHATGDGIDVSLKEVAVLLRDARSVLIVTHRNPDGDAVGAATALAAGLRALGKHVSIVCPDALPDYLLEMPGAREIGQDMAQGQWDVVVSVDVSDPALLQPLPCADPEYFRTRQSINLDHHYSNFRYARFNHVDPDAASATEIVSALVRDDLHVPLTTAIATDLLYGIVNDTHSFQNSNTTPRTLRLAADLVEAGADLSRVVFNLLLERSAAAARLWAQVLPSLTFEDHERVAFLTVSTQALDQAGADMTDADGLVEFLRYIRTVDLAVLFKQTGREEFRLSIRTSAAVDATVVAAAFGGGGHQRAAGGDARGSLKQIQRRLLEVYRASREASPV